MLHRLNRAAQATMTATSSTAWGMLSGNGDLFRSLILAVIALHIAGSIAAVLTNVMLHGDGAYFVFALALEDAWALKWRDISARASIYLFTVLPTYWISQAADLSPLDIAKLNGFIFYAVPALQYAVAAAIVWRSHPEYLVFPVVQYALSTSLGYGFPSEILLAPGFLWIALFLVLTNRVWSVWFAAAFAALVFCHELALPAALITAGLALTKLYEGGGKTIYTPKFVIMSLFLGGAFGTFILIQVFGGAAGSSSNIIYVFDPRRVLNNPSMWLVFALTAATALTVHRIGRPAGPRWVVPVLIIAAALLPLVLQSTATTLDFEQGRYDSTRTVVGGFMFLLTAVFAASLLHSAEPASRSFHTNRFTVFCALAVALAVTTGSAAAFLRDWSYAQRGLAKAVTPSETANTPIFIPYQQARAFMTARERRAMDRIDFHWALPYRSIVLADTKLPSRIVYSEHTDYQGACRELASVNVTGTVLSPAIVESYRQFTCAHPSPPPVDTISRRFLRWLREMLGLSQ